MIHLHLNRLAGCNACFASAALALGALAAPAAPPGHNIHLVQETAGSRFWRGGALRRDTLTALAESARARGKKLTLVDLRSPANRDDRSGNGGRLSPAAEESAAARLGAEYVPISALAPDLPDRLSRALAHGDVYMHCMYGVNRTGFAVARYARFTGMHVSRVGLGERDWNQGAAFEERLQRRASPPRR